VARLLHPRGAVGLHSPLRGPWRTRAGRPVSRNHAPPRLPPRGVVGRRMVPPWLLR
jgi:hypothetical protein